MNDSDQSPNWHPGSLLQLSGSYWQPFTLQAGVKLDLFTLLARKPLSGKQVAEALNLDARGAGMLLNALSAMGLILKSGEQYEATAAADRFLNQASPEYIGHMIMHHHHLADSWSRMDEAVRSGRPLRSRASNTDEEKREAFLMGMYNTASQQAPLVAGIVDLKSRRRLLDLGGGPGTYAIHFCRENPELKATVFDLPTTRPFCEKTVERHGLTNRIEFKDGNFLHDPIAGTYDVAWLSHILHAEGPESCRQIIAKVVDALKPGGIVLIHDFFMFDSMDGPLFPALFALNMLQGTEQGQSYSESDVRQMLEKAGAKHIIRLDYCGPTESGILKGVRA